LVGGVGKKLTFIYSGFIQFRDIREPQHFAKRENEPRWQLAMLIKKSQTQTAPPYSAPPHSLRRKQLSYPV